MTSQFEVRSNIFVFKNENDPLSPVIEKQGSYNTYDLFTRIHRDKLLKSNEILYKKVIRVFSERICGPTQKIDRLLNKVSLIPKSYFYSYIRHQRSKSCKEMAQKKKKHFLLQTHLDGEIERSSIVSRIFISKKRSDPLSILIHRSGQYDVYKLFLHIFKLSENRDEMMDVLMTKLNLRICAKKAIKRLLQEAIPPSESIFYQYVHDKQIEKSNLKNLAEGSCNKLNMLFDFNRKGKIHKKSDLQLNPEQYNSFNKANNVKVLGREIDANSPKNSLLKTTQQFITDSSKTFSICSRGGIRTDLEDFIKDKVVQTPSPKDGINFTNDEMESPPP